jgi:hypothetical protein
MPIIPKKRPLRLDSMDRFDDCRIPYLGDHCKVVDTRKTRLDTLFVDSSGFGSSSEPALTYNAFKVKLGNLIDNNGPVFVAVEASGQFQVYVAIWK